MKNQRGMITLDFLFAFILVLTFGTILFAFSLTLTVVEVTQYITYASARNFMAGHISMTAQVTQAEAKFNSLVTHPVFRPLFNNNWYTIDPNPDVGDLTMIQPAYKAGATPANKFIGVGTTFTARVLEFNSPVFGSTDVAGTGTGDNFKTYIASYLGREPTSEDCILFARERWNAIRSLQPVGGNVAYAQTPTTSSYRIYDDNGW